MEPSGPHLPSRLPGDRKRAALAKSKDPSVRIGEALDEIADLERELEFLEAELPPLQAKLDAAIRPIFDRIVAVRQEVVSIVERASGGFPRRSSLKRDAEELVAHLVSDLEERFGVRMVSGAEEFLDEEDEGGFSGDDFSWAGPQRHSPREEAVLRHRVRHAPPDPESAAKGIYRALAMELHPDKTRDDGERTRRTELMQNLTQAWKERDLGSLLRLLHAHGSDEAKAGALDGASLAACAHGLEVELAALRTKVRNLRHQGLPGGVVDWMPLLRDPKLFERLLRREKAGPREELEQMIRWRNQWRLPGGLERFLREVPDHLWAQVV